MSVHRASACLLAGLLLAVSSSAHADDHLLTIGGGPSLNSNQISLENNVRYLQRALARMKLQGIDQKILFSDGGDPARDLQYEAVYPADDARLLLADIVGSMDGIRESYRSSSLPAVNGSAMPETIEKTVKDLSTELNPGDRLIVYFTGHGGPAKRDGQSTFRMSFGNVEANIGIGANSSSDSAEGGRARPSKFANNIMHLWNDNDLSVVEWTQKLDELSIDVPVVAIMVQCYSGGFGNFVFAGGDPNNGLAKHPRCGFFSTVPDRVAAGCTPNVNEAEYREYSSYFFEALCGESRTGQSVTLPDYDHDGRTSLLEAHAYTVIHADTIDIPVRTSDIYLRQVSKTKGKDGLLTSGSPITELLAQAGPCETTVIEELSKEFQLTGTDREKDVDEAIKAKRAEKQKFEANLRRHRQTVGNIKRDIAGTIRKRWPEVSNAWNPGVSKILAEDGDEIRKAIVEHESYLELQLELEDIDKLAKESESCDLQIVKLERLKYWLESIALAANLKTLEETEKLDGLRRLVELESQFITPGNVVSTTSTNG
ncbi:hypothetical protein [Lacunimicrobium album]